MPSRVDMQDGAPMPKCVDARGGGAKLRRGLGARRAAGCLGIIVALTVVTACSGSSGNIAQPPPKSTSSTAPTVSPTGSPDTRVLAQYRRFWTVLTPASRAAATRRQSMLAEVAAAP